MELFANFQRSLPMPFYTAADGIENLAAHWGVEDHDPARRCAENLRDKPDLGLWSDPTLF